MMRKLSAVLVVAMAIVLGALAIGTGSSQAAADPAGGRVDGTNKVVTWSGGPFAVPNPVPGCTGPQDQFCDHYALTVDSAPGDLVSVSILARDDRDALSLYVFDGDRTVASLSSAHSGSPVVFSHRGGTVVYEVRVQPGTMGGGGLYDGMARLSQGTIVDPEIDCTELIPAAVGVSGVTDQGQRIALNVAVLVDTTITVGNNEVTSDVASRNIAATMTTAKRSYAPLGLDLNVISTTLVDIDGDDAEAMTAQAKALLGGRRPGNADLVYIATPQDIQAGDDYAVAGVADCIGGVRAAKYAFAIGEVFDDPSFGILGVRFYADLNAKIVAHELGHVMGAHHHYSNCVQGAGALLVRQLGPCTLMAPFADFLTLDFGAVEAAVVRGHATEFAAP